MRGVFASFCRASAVRISDQMCTYLPNWRMTGYFVVIPEGALRERETRTGLYHEKPWSALRQGSFVMGSWHLSLNDVACCRMFHDPLQPFCTVCSLAFRMPLSLLLRAGRALSNPGFQFSEWLSREGGEGLGLGIRSSLLLAHLRSVYYRSDVEASAPPISMNWEILRGTRAVLSVDVSWVFPTWLRVQAGVGFEKRRTESNLDKF